MAVGPKLDQRTRIGFVETLFSEDLKAVHRYGSRIRDDAMDDFESINIGLVFLPAAVTIRDRLREESKYRCDQEQSRQAGPIGYSTDSPTRTPTIQSPVERMVSREEKKQGGQGGQD